ncbi:extracellular solute-binding protein [Tabrizicola sp.]|uniref:extracellular solute-binding protein n=1 Tax=Tabrizicola sp. TaxID=2005166 RepID=UPI003F3DA854
MVHAFPKCRSLPFILAATLAPIAPLFAETTVTIVSGQESQNGDVLKEIFAGFDAADTSVAIDLQIDNKNDLETAQRVLADIVAGNPPDAVRVTGAIFSTFLHSGRAQPLDACLDSQPALKAQLDPSLLDILRGPDGKLYAMPFYTTLPALYINATAFREAGLDPAKPPATWAELKDAAAKLSDASTGKFGVLMYMPNTYLFEAQAESAGAQWIDASGSPSINSPAAVETMAFMRGLVEDGQMPAIAPSAFWSEFAALFRSGDLGMMIFPSSSFPQLTGGVDFEVTLAPMPIREGGNVMANASANGFVMLATDPEAQAATCKALSALVTPEAVTRIVMATATVPHNTEAAKGEAYLAPYFAANPAFAAVNSQPSDAWFAIPGNENTEFQSRFGDIQFEILNGDVSAADGIARLQDALADLMPDG